MSLTTNFSSPARATAADPTLDAAYHVEPTGLDPLPSFLDTAPDWKLSFQPNLHPSTLASGNERSQFRLWWVPISCVFLPYAFGFYLSFLHRTIMSLLSKPLTAEFELTPADLGLLASMYFLSFAAVQLPLGIWLDRIGPKRVQLTLLTIATLGAAVFTISQSFTSLMIGRMLIGLGVAGALMAGLKAIILWFPSERLALINGIFIMLGGFGAITATAPLEPVLELLGWRGLSSLLTLATALSVCLVFFVVPERRHTPHTGKGATMSVREIFADRRFWRIAPLSGTVIGSAWALQGLWAAPWFMDVEGYNESEVMMILMHITLGLPIGAFLFGFVADRLRHYAFTAADVLAGATCLSLAAQLSLILRLPVDPLVPWIMIGALGSGTALSYTSLAETFPQSASARANGALNLLHMGIAFGVQAAIGIIIELWPGSGGHYPVVAYQVAFGLNFAMQGIALMWFLLPQRRIRHRAMMASSGSEGHQTEDVHRPTCYDIAASSWNAQFTMAQRQLKAWRTAAIASAGLVITLAATIVILASNSVAIPYVIPLTSSPLE